MIGNAGQALNADSTRSSLQQVVQASRAPCVTSSLCGFVTQKAYLTTSFMVVTSQYVFSYHIISDEGISLMQQTLSDLLIQIRL